jgi:hypothetical protein
MRTSTARYYEDLLLQDRILELTLEEAKADLARNYLAVTFGSLN